MMGRAIAFDLLKNSPETQIQLADTNKQTLQSAQQFLNNTALQTIPLDINSTQQVKKQFITSDIVISAVPYHYNYTLTQLAIQTHTHFLDLGGNNDIVFKQRSLCNQAKKKQSHHSTRLRISTRDDIYYNPRYR